MKVGDRMITVFKKSFEVTERSDAMEEQIEEGIERSIRVQIVEGDNWYVYKSSNWVDRPEPADVIRKGPFDFLSANEAALLKALISKLSAKKAASPYPKAPKQRMKRSTQLQSKAETADSYQYQFRPAACVDSALATSSVHNTCQINGNDSATTPPPGIEMRQNHIPIDHPPSLVAGNLEAHLNEALSKYTTSQTMTPESSPSCSVEGIYGVPNISYPPPFRTSTPITDPLLSNLSNLDPDARRSVLPSSRVSSLKRGSTPLGPQSPPKRVKSELMFKSDTRMHLKSIPSFIPPPPLLISPCREELYDRLR